MTWVQIAGSLAAILVLAGIARMLKLGESRIVDTATARAFAEEALAGFVAREAVVGTDGRAAVVAGNGTIAVLKRHGARVAVPPLRLYEAVEGVSVDTGERSFGRITLFGVIADDVRRLELGIGSHLRAVD
jgi:hypothetical protein